MILYWNKWAAFNILMTCHLIFVTQGTLRTEHPSQKENTNCALFKDKIPLKFKYFIMDIPTCPIFPAVRQFHYGVQFHR